MPINPFVSLFGRSPIGPMQQHMAKSHECAANLVPLFQAITAEDWERVEQIQKEMARLENICPRACFCRFRARICWSC